MRLLVTRAQPDADRQAETLRARGHQVMVEPVLRLEFPDTGALPLEGTQALVATSRNALRALGRSGSIDRARALPLYVVGPATAAMGEELGFADVRQGGGTAPTLEPLIAEDCDPARGALLHPAGERLAFDLKGALEARGFEVRQPVVYRMAEAETLSPTAREALQAGTIDGVLLMSPATARTWARLLREAGLDPAAAAIRHYCLSQGVADALPVAGTNLAQVAEAPNEEALLALIARHAAQ